MRWNRYAFLIKLFVIFIELWRVWIILIVLVLCRARLNKGYSENGSLSELFLLNLSHGASRPRPRPHPFHILSISQQARERNEEREIYCGYNGFIRKSKHKIKAHYGQWCALGAAHHRVGRGFTLAMGGITTYILPGLNCPLFVH